MNARRALVAVLLMLGSARSVIAQVRPVEWPRWQAPVVASSHGPRAADSLSRQHPVDTPLLVLGGLTGGTAGLFGGGLVGHALGGGGRLCGDDPCGLAGAVYGAIGGEMVLLPLGVHLANNRRGSYAYSLLASVAVGALGIGLAGATDSAELLLAIPIGQLVSSVLIERATSPRKRITR